MLPLLTYCSIITYNIVPPDNACSELPSVENGGVVYSDLNLAPGASGRYVCNEGYLLITFYDSYKFTCTEEGIWDGNVTEVPVACQCKFLAVQHLVYYY